MNPVNFKSGSYVKYNVNYNGKDRKFQVGDHVRISNYKNNFVKGYIPNWSKEVPAIKKVENTVPWTYVISDLNGEKMFRIIYET